jgi:hypothetical protein
MNQAKTHDSADLNSPEGRARIVEQRAKNITVSVLTRTFRDIPRRRRTPRRLMVVSSAMSMLLRQAWMDVE